MTHPQGPFKSLLGPKPVTALPAPASFQAPALQEASISIPQTSTARSSSEVETRQGDAAIRKVHFILNSKGGVGKSFVAFLLALHYRHLREPVLCFDADATTATFSRFAALNVTRITLMEGTILNARRFDEMLEPILAEDAHCVVDTGTSSFVAVSHYLIENDVHEQIRLSGKKVVVHAIIVGGSTLKETLNDLYELARQLPPEVDIVVWLNEHFGLIKQGDKTFTDMEVFKQNRHRIRGMRAFAASDRGDLWRRHQGDDGAPSHLRGGRGLARFHADGETAPAHYRDRRAQEAAGGPLKPWSRRISIGRR